MTSLAIVEPHCSGHRMQYVRLIVREALSRGNDVTFVTTAGCLEHPLYRSMQHECDGRVKPVILSGSERLDAEHSVEEPGTANLVKREFLYHKLYSRHFGALAIKSQPDFVFAPYMDYCTYAIGLKGSPFASVPWGGILLRPSFHFNSVGVNAPAPRLAALKRELLFKMLKNQHLRKAFTIDETLSAYIDQERPEYLDKLSYVPDPVSLSGTSTRAEARRDLEISDSTVILLVYGALTLRKGIDELLSAARRPDFPGEVCILFAGRQDQEVQRLLTSSVVNTLRETGRIREIDRFLADEEEYMLFRAADVVWLGYRNHYGSSGVLYQAGMMGLPVVACDAGLVDWLTRKHGLGLTVSVQNARDVASVVTTLARDWTIARRFGENGRELSRQHNGEAFAAEILKETCPG